LTDHAVSLNHVIDWDQAKVIDRESHRVDRWIKEAIHTLYQEGARQVDEQRRVVLPTLHIYDNLFARNLSGEQRLDTPFRRRL